MTSTTANAEPTVAVIRVKRRIDQIANEDAVANGSRTFAPETLLVKRTKVKDSVEDDLGALVYKLHHSTNSESIENDPRIAIPRVKVSKPKAPNASPKAPSASASQIRPSLKVLGHARLTTANGAHLKVLNLESSSGDCGVPDDSGSALSKSAGNVKDPEYEALPPAIREMMREYEATMDLKLMQNEISKIDTADNFVYDVYYFDGAVSSTDLQESGRSVSGGAGTFWDSNGANVTFELELEEYGRYFGSEFVSEFDKDSEDGCAAEGEEDSNAEDDYRNDYPDSDDYATDVDSGNDSDSFEHERRYVYEEY